MIEWWKDFYREYDVPIITTLVVIIMIVCSVGLVATTQYKSCNVYSEMGIKVIYNFWTGCMANHPKFGWVPIDEYFKILNMNIP